MKLQLDRKNKTEHLYLEVYHYYKNLILEQKLPSGSKMPSLRKCSQELKLSRTTIETPTSSSLPTVTLLLKLKADIM